MKVKFTPMRAACAVTGAAIAGIFIATIAMNAMRLYNAVRPVEFCIVPLCIILAALNMAGGVKSNAEDARRKGEGAGCREVVADRVLLMCALACTMCADIFMVLLGGFYPLSLSFFAAAQLLYCARIQLYRRNKKYTAAALSVRAAASVVLCVAAVCIMPGNELLGAIAAFYFINLIFNAAEAALLAARGRTKELLLFALGLVLFIGCDVCVGLNAGGMAGIKISPAGLYAINILIWVFYFPSQVLLALSSPLKTIEIGDKNNR